MFYILLLAEYGFLSFDFGMLVNIEILLKLKFIIFDQVHTNINHLAVI
jgi:hypothetical protein